ncbi:MAG: transglycosylase domain-containing protein [Actinomycetes bacterium]
MDALRPPMTAGFVSRSLLFLGVSVLSGVLVAGLALPLLGSIGLVARESSEGFENLPAELETPPLPQRSRILASDGSLIATFFYENRAEVPLAEVAPVMRQAVVAIEDSRFYQHGGIDLRGTVRAFINNQSGDDVQGGSTLTQQYVKQVLLESAQNLKDDKARIAAQRSATEQSYGRKLRELRYAVTLEERFGKNEILERYLNIAYFGAGAYGVEAAARHYFSKSSSKLTLAESALLAGIVQQPSAYDPTRDPAAALARRNVVLDRMADVGYATPEEIAEARASKIALKVPKNVGNGCNMSRVPFFCDYVLNTILNDPAFGKEREERLRLLLRGGLTIRTTLDRKMQRAAQRALRDHVDKTDKVASAVVSVEPGSGHIKAMAVSRDFGDGKNQIKFNPATDKAYGGSNGFQAGSAFKPFVAAAALEKGYPFGYRIHSPYQKVIGDVKACSGTLTDEWDPFNETSSENGNYTLETGMEGSINTYFAQLEERVGVCRPATIARAMGMTRADGEPLQQVKSFVLGTNEVSPLSMAEAYATFAARGTHCNSVAISRVVDPGGRSLAVPRADCKQVIDEDIADGINELLQEVIKDGTGQRAAIDRPAAGKTGTTNRRVSVWFVGYTPELSTAVWAGNPSPPKNGYPLQNRTIGGVFYSSICGGCLPGPIWAQTMTDALDGVRASDFTDAPASVRLGDASRMPSVSGRSVEQARAILRRLDVDVNVSGDRVYASYADEGEVAYSSPGSGSRVYPGQTVILYISKGPRPEPERTKPEETKSPDPNCDKPRKRDCD